MATNVTYDSEHMSDQQWTRLMGIVDSAGGWDVKYPHNIGDDCLVTHATGMKWIIDKHGEVTEAPL